MRPPPLPSSPVPTAHGYDLWSAIYDEEQNPLIALEEREWPAVQGDVRGLDVVDLGCGTGRASLRLLAGGARVTAVEFSAGMVERARSKPGWDHVRFVEHDLLRPLPFAAAAFDRSTCCLVLDHINEPRALFSEMRRVLRPGGKAVVSVMHPAMLLRGIQAHFTDPATGRDVHPESAPNSISDYVTGALATGLAIEHLSEHAVDEPLARSSPRAVKYLGWPMLLLMRLGAPA